MQTTTSPAPRKICNTAAEVGFDHVAMEHPAMRAVIQEAEANLTPAEKTAVYSLAHTFRHFVYGRAGGAGMVAMSLIGAELRVLAELGRPPRG